MAIQSKTVAELKSEVLQTSSRPYELIEYDPDKIFTGQINPDLINSDIATYERSLAGTVIIDKNKNNLSNQKMLISLNTTKISNAKFNQIIDTEFQDFPAAADTSLLFLEGKLAMLESKTVKTSFEKSLLLAEIDSLNEQIQQLKDALAVITAPLINNIPDSIPYGIELNSDIESGIGSMILSKNRKARAKFALDGPFYITLGNYDVDGRLIDGEEKSTFITPFAGNVGTQVLTDAEAAQYLINNSDLEPYFNSYTVEAAAKATEIESNTYNNLAALVLDFKNLYPSQPSPQSLDSTNAFLSAQIQDANSNVSKNTRRNILKADMNLVSYNYVNERGESRNFAIDGGDINNVNVSDIKAIQQFVTTRQRDYMLNPGDGSTETARKISYFKGFYTDMYYGIRNRFILIPQAPFEARIIALRREIVNKIRNFENIGPAYSIETPGGSTSIPIDSLILPADRALLGKKNISNWSATSNLIEAAKNHWKYVVNDSPGELSFRSYLSDDQARAYLNNYSDLREAFGDNLQQAKQHWNFNGINEGRSFAVGNTILRIWRSSSDKKGYIELVKTNPWHVRWTSDYIDLSKSSRMFLDDNGILYLYDKEKIVWQSYNEDAA
jgi:hypothetical protein